MHGSWKAQIIDSFQSFSSVEMKARYTVLFSMWFDTSFCLPYLSADTHLILPWYLIDILLLTDTDSSALPVYVPNTSLIPYWYLWGILPNTYPDTSLSDTFTDTTCLIPSCKRLPDTLPNTGRIFSWHFTDTFLTLTSSCLILDTLLTRCWQVPDTSWHHPDTSPCRLFYLSVSLG